MNPYLKSFLGTVVLFVALGAVSGAIYGLFYFLPMGVAAGILTILWCWLIVHLYQTVR